ncbi:MAG: hypothetical protein AB1649_23790, partial [Chloroflexota bacterium]
ADAHSLPEITEKRGVRGAYAPHAHPFFRDFLQTVRCNTKTYLEARPSSRNETTVLHVLH